MKLFTFFSRKAATPLPKTPVAAAFRDTGTFEPVTDLIALLILKVVQAFPNRGEDSYLLRFFEKTSIAPAVVRQRKNELLRDEMLVITVVKQTGTYFALTEKGALFLKMHFDFENMIAFAKEIEPKGFIATLLVNLSEKERRS